MSGSYLFKWLDLSNLQEMMEIERSSFDSPWSAQMMRDSLSAAHTKAVGLFVGDQLIGYVILSILLDEAEVLSMAISPEYHGRGYGKSLLAYGLDQARILGAKTVFLEVRVTHDIALGLYRKLGFEVISKRANYYPNIHTGGFDDALVMRLSMTERLSNEEGKKQRKA